MEQWGAGLYGNPCRDCVFGWDLTPEQAVASVRAAPAAYTRNNAHDTHHHLWDITRILSTSTATGTM